MWHVANGDAEIRRKLGFFDGNSAKGKREFNSAKLWTQKTLAMLRESFPDKTTPNATYCLFRAAPSGDVELLAEGLHQPFPLKRVR